MSLTELNFKNQERTGLLPLPSRATFERGVKKIPIPYIKYFRENEKIFIGQCAPYIKRIYNDLESNDIWVADNHTFDIMVGKNDVPVRVYLTAFMDVRSRKFTGWCITDAPASDATIYALKKGCEFHGVPKALYTDNGRKFLFHDLGGNGFRKKKKGDTVKLPSILDDFHSGEGMHGKTPDEVFAANLIEKRVIPNDKLNLMFMRYAKGNKGTIKVGKNGVSLTFYGQELQYFDEDLWKLYFGRNVYVRYSPDDLSSVRVYDDSMKFICTAELRTQLSYKATKAEIQAQQQENRGAVKAVKAYKRQKGIVAQNELKLILDEAERNINVTNTISEDEARERLIAYKEKTGKSQTEIAKGMGISDPKLSQFLSGTYKSPGAMIPQIMRFLDMDIKKEVAPREPGFCRTTISGTVIDLIAYCHIQRKIGVAYGDAGVGKTMGIREYQRQNPDSAIVITVSPCFATMTGVNELIAEELRIREKISRKIYAEAVHKLRGSNRVIIIDEAQHLTVRVINHLRCMADESGVGMAFVGNEEIYMKMRGSGQASYAQYFSRIADNKHLLTSQITREDIELVFNESGINPQAVDVLLKISRTNYGLRGAVNVFVNTAAVYNEVTAKGIARMAREMNIG